MTPPNDDDDEGWWLVAGHPSWAQTRDPGPGNILTFLINSAATAQPRAAAVTRLAQSVTQCYKAALQSVTRTVLHTICVTASVFVASTELYQDAFPGF